MAKDMHVWFAGIDWGSQKYQTCVLDAQGTIIGEQEFLHSGKGLTELSDWILSITGSADAVAVGIELPHGPVVDAVLARGFAVYAINPKQLDRLRDRFSVAGAKDDRRDAYVSADCLRTDQHLFSRVQVSDPRLTGLRACRALPRNRRRNENQLSKSMMSALFDLAA